MLKAETFQEAHIRALQQQSQRDPALLERTIFAFGLLEALARVGMPFIFKGGTCLMLLLPELHRLSTDIDIIVEPGLDIDTYIAKAATIFPFQHEEEQKRVGRNQIVKRHFKFVYDSPLAGKKLPILLDVLFEHPRYVRTVQGEIRNQLLLTEPPYLPVTMPSVECILGDKLTAFAPQTTGIPLHAGKDMEVMKQLYDVSTLLDAFSNFAAVRETYFKVVADEIAYRGGNLQPETCLWDTFHASLCIASRGKYLREDYPLYVNGIRNLRGHIFSEKYTPELALLRAAKTAYMALCLLANEPYQRVQDVEANLQNRLQHDELAPVRFLRHAVPEAYGYMVQADLLLDKLA